MLCKPFTLLVFLEILLSHVHWEAFQSSVGNGYLASFSSNVLYFKNKKTTFGAKSSSSVTLFVHQTKLSTIHFIFTEKLPYSQLVLLQNVAKCLWQRCLGQKYLEMLFLKEEWNWKNQATWIQALLQSHSYQNSMVLAQRQKYRSMEQNRKPRDKSTHIWTPYLWQRRQEYTMD